MISRLAPEEIEFLTSEDLHSAERHFEDIKARVLSGVAADDSLTRTRQYLRAIEDILADKHEARRATAGGLAKANDYLRGEPMS